MTALPCDQCLATPCCRRRSRADYAAAVLPGEVERIPNQSVLRPLRDGVMAIEFNAQGDCPFLLHGRCSIYSVRPLDCARFDCSTHRPFLAEHPGVVALLTREGIPVLTPNE